MKTTDYAGIDYGHGKSNISEAGIRFGVIGQNSADLPIYCAWNRLRACRCAT
jgi:hypothetical protein